MSLSLPVVVACSANVTEEPEGEKVATSSEALATVCPSTYSALSCCVGSPLAWDLTDGLQKQLSTWGCSAPHAFAPNKSTGGWWFWSTCTDTNQRVESFLNANPKFLAAPYSTKVLANTSTLSGGATACMPPPPAGQVLVFWDPTCATCLLK